jgi:hypothetical protein
MRRWVLFGCALAVTALIVFLPYKHAQTMILGTATTSAIYEEIAHIGLRNLPYLAFLFLLLPPLLIVQVWRSPVQWYKRLLFVLEGLAALAATLLMALLMTMELFEEKVRYTPVLYLSIGWVLLGSICAFVVVSSKAYGKFSGAFGGQ